MAEGRNVGRAEIDIFGDDSPLQRTLRRLESTVLRPIVARIEAQGAEAAESAVDDVERAVERLDHKVALVIAEAQTEGAQRNLKELLREADRVASRILELEVNADTGTAKAELAALRAYADALVRTITMNIDVDAGGAAAELAAVSAAAEGAEDSFRSAGGGASMFASENKLLAAAIIALLTALGPLTALLAVAGSGIMSLVGIFGLFAAAAIPTIVNLTKQKVAQQQAEQAAEQHAQASEQLAQSEAQLAKTEDQVAESVGNAADQIEQSVEQYKRARQQAEQSNRSAQQQVQSMTRAVTQARQQAAEADRQAAMQYRDSVEAYREAQEQGRQQIRDAVEQYQSALQALSQTRRQAAQDYKEALDQIQGAEQSLAQTRRQVARDNRAAIEAIRSAERALASTIQQERENIASARAAYADSIDQVIQNERQLVEARRGVVDATEQLSEAQRNLNAAMRDEPLTQAELALNVERQRLSIAQTRQRMSDITRELQEAQFMGDTSRIQQLKLELQSLQLQQQQNSIDLTRSEREKTEAQKRGSEQLRAAREQVEQAWQQRADAINTAREAAETLQDSRNAAAEAFQEINQSQVRAAQAVDEAQRRVQEARQQAAITEAEGARRIAEQEERVLEARQNAAQVERQGAQAIARAQGEVESSWKNIRSTMDDVHNSISDARDSMIEAHRQMFLTQRSGIRSIQESVRQLNQAEQQARITRTEGIRSVRDALDQVRSAEENYQETRADGDQQIQESMDRVAESRGKVSKAYDEMIAKQQAANKATATQNALMAAGLAFWEKFQDSFEGANDAFNNMAIDMIEFFGQTLPYLGGIAEQIINRTHDALNALQAQWMEPRQLAVLRDFFERLPEQSYHFWKGLGQLLTGTFNILIAAGPYVSEFTKWFDQITARYLDWTQSVEGREALRSFFEDMMPLVREFFTVLGHVIQGLWDLFTSPQGQEAFDNILEIIDGLAKALPYLRIFFGFLNGIINFVQFLVGLLPGELGPAFVGVGLSILGVIAVAAGLKKITGWIGGMTRGLFGFGKMKDRQAANVTWFGALSRKTFKSIGTWIGFAASQLLLFGKYIYRQVARAFSWLVERAVQAGRSAGNGLARLWVRFIEGARGLSRWFGRILSGLDDVVRGWVRVQRYRIAQWVERIVILFRGLLKSARAIFGSIVEVVASRLGGLGRVVRAVLGPVGRFFAWFFETRIGGAIIGFIAKYLSRRGLLLGALRLLGPRIAGALGGPIGLILTLLIGPFTRFLTYLVYEFWPRLKAVIRALFSGRRSVIISELENFHQTLKNAPFLGPLLEKAWNFGTALGKWLKNSLIPWAKSAFRWLGDTMIWSWIMGIYDRAKDLWSSITKLATSIVDVVHKIFQFGSPSKVFRWFGRMIAEGLGRGIEGGIGFVEKVADKMGRAVSDRTQRTVDDVSRSVAKLTDLSLDNAHVDRALATVSATRDREDGLAQAVSRQSQDLARMVGKQFRGGIPDGSTFIIPVHIGDGKVREMVFDVVGGELRESKVERRPPFGVEQ